MVLLTYIWWHAFCYLAVCRIGSKDSDLAACTFELFLFNMNPLPDGTIPSCIAMSNPLDWLEACIILYLYCLPKAS